MYPWIWWFYKQWLELQNGLSPPAGPATPGVNYRWYHRDEDLVGETIAALDTAKRGAWKALAKTDLVRQFRALLLATLRAATLSHVEPFALGDLHGGLYSTDERRAVASTIARTIVLLGPPYAVRPKQDIHSEDSAPSKGSFETALGAIAIVVLASVVAIAAAFLGTVIAQAVAAVNFDDEVTRRLLAAHARALEVVALHVDRERVAGRELPFDESELLLIRSLEEQQRKLATLQHRALPTPFEGAAEFVKTTSSSILPLAAVAAVVFLLLNEKGR